ncbi:MAG: ADP-ribosylation factor-like protein [Candidatus Hermodarchaeota archaeon]
MLTNIFLFIGKNFQDIDHLNIYNYPNDAISINKTDLIKKIIYSHDQREKNIAKSNNPINSPLPNIPSLNQHFIIDKPIPQIIDGLNIYTSCINDEIIIGLIFDKDDNPYDYQDIFIELLNDLLNIENVCTFEDEFEIENLLITIFIDIRRFGDEYVQQRPLIEFQYEESFIKVFLFGIDDVGKSSLSRRIKTGEYNDNYFIPTKKFSINYIKRKDQPWLLALWDMPGQQTFRKKWVIGLQDSNIVIYMIDIANQRRFEEAKKEFWKIINRFDIEGIPLLILANKIDLLEYSEKDSNDHFQRLRNEIISYFEFDKIKNRQWQLKFTSVKTNFNIESVIYDIFNLI